MKKTKKPLLRREIERLASRGKLALCTLAADLDEFRRFENSEVMSVHGLLQLARGPRNSYRRQQQKLGLGGWRGGRQWVVVVVTELSNKLSVFFLSSLRSPLIYLSPFFKNLQCFSSSWIFPLPSKRTHPPKKKLSPSFFKGFFFGSSSPTAYPPPSILFFLSTFGSLSKRTQKNPQNDLQKNPKENLKTWKHGMWETLCPPLLLFFFFYLFYFFFFDCLYFF